MGKRTMTKEEFTKLVNNPMDYWGFYDQLSAAGISFDIYTDSYGTIIKPGDKCEFWDHGGKILTRYFQTFIVAAPSGCNFITTHDDAFIFCRKLPTEVWVPVPMEDVSFIGGECQYLVNGDIWTKSKVVDGKLMGVRK